MFNPEIPYNDLPFLPPQNIDFESPIIIKQLMRAKVELAKLDVLTKNKLDNKEIFLEPFAIRESVESSQIENIHTTISDVYKSEYEVVMSPSQKETLSYKDALMYGYKILMEKGFLNTNHIAEIGKILNPSKGVIRTTLGVYIGSTDWRGKEEPLYTPPIGMNSVGNNSISDLLKNYENFFNNGNENIDPLIQMALIHYQFEAIHPFYDGNGRTGRVLMILHLIMKQQLCFPILFISAFINKNKSDYYRLLRSVTSHNSWEEFIVYILTAIEVQSKNTVATIEKLIEYRYDLRIQLSQIDSLKSKDAEVIFNLLSSQMYISLDELKEKTGVSINTGTKLFKIIIDNNLGSEKRIGNNKVIFNKDFLKIFDK